MRKIILGIHGLGNKPPEHVLNEWWIRSIEEGFEKINIKQFRLPFELAYWSFYLHPVALDPYEKNSESLYYLGDPYVPSDTPPVNKPHEFRRKVLEYLEKQLDKLMLREDFSINFSAISDLIIRRFFKDLDIYFNANCVDEAHTDCLARDAIRSELYNKLVRYRRRKILLIAHSMGSIIAYDVLMRHAEELTIDTFVTIGSPLGVPVLMQRLAREHHTKIFDKLQLPTPDCIQNSWYNFSDLSDKVAFNYNLADDFKPNRFNVQPIDAVVFNDYVYKGVHNPHKAYGYLRTPEVAEIVQKFLEKDELRILIWFRNLIDKWRARFESR